jgi:hypothetical protein
MEQAMTNAIDTLSTSTLSAATRADSDTAYFHPDAFSIFHAWRIAGPILQSAIDAHSPTDPDDTRLNALVAAFGHFEMLMLKQPATTLADVQMKLEAFFATDDEWLHGREVKDAVLSDLRRLRQSGDAGGAQNIERPN